MIDLIYCDDNIKMLVDVFKNYARSVDYNTDIFENVCKFSIDAFGILLVNYNMSAVTQNDHFNLMAKVYEKIITTEECKKCLNKRDVINNWIKLSKENNK